MSQFYNNENFNINDLQAKEITLEKKVSSIIFFLNGIDIQDKIVEPLNLLKSLKTEAIGAYEAISTILKEELSTLIEDIYQLKLKVIEVEKRISFISNEIREYAKSSDPHKTLNTSEEYSNFLKAYEEALVHSQEIVRKNQRVEVIMETQKILDMNYTPKIIEIDCQINSLHKFIEIYQQQKLDSNKITYSDSFSNYKEFQQLIFAKDIKFEEIKKSLNIESSGFIPQNPFIKNGANSIDTIFNDVNKKFLN